jgi:regulator of replication initiation timing
MLKTNLEHMEALKQRIKELEQSNEVFALENEDLRQFSLDGYDIAKNV